MEAILAKARAFISSAEGRRKRDMAVETAMATGKRLESGQKIYRPEEAAEKFIEILIKHINDSPLTSGAVEAVSDIQYETPKKLFGKAGSYTVRIYFAGDMSRESLVAGGIDDIVALFNNGVDHEMKRVYGMWHGKYAGSRTRIPPTHFIERARDEFMNRYADTYHVTDITVDI